MALVDRLVPVQPGRITLVAKKTFGVSGNIRVVTQELARRRTRDVFLYYEGPLSGETADALRASGVQILRDLSPRAAHVLASSELLVVDHSIRDCYVTSRKPGRKIANVWHGVPIKGIELAMPSIPAQRQRQIEHNATLYDYMLASSKVDRLAISACFGVAPRRVSAAGLPRYDLLRDDYPLPADLCALESDILERKANTRLVLWAPTFREHSGSPLRGTLTEIEALARDLAASGMSLGVRPHPYDRWAKKLHDVTGILNFASEKYPETNLLLKHTDVLVTDFSSLWVDFVLTGRPILGFSRDFEEYRDNERGFLYEFESVFPGPFVSSFADLRASVLGLDSSPRRRDYSLQEQLFFPPSLSSGRYSELVAEELLQLLD